MARVIALITFLAFAACALADNDVGTWNITDTSSKVCIRMQAKITFLVTYQSGDSKNSTTKTATIVMKPSETEAVGNCNPNTPNLQSITFTFFNNKTNGYNWDLSMSFTANTTAKTFTMNYVVADVNFKLPAGIFESPPVDFGLIKYENSTSPSWLHSTIGKSYKCVNGDSNLHLTPKTGDNTTLTVRFDSLRLQPFNGDATQFNDDGEQCAADSAASDLVPIIVGACLALLVIIVLIAYLIGRVRAKRQGYSSV